MPLTEATLILVAENLAKGAIAYIGSLAAKGALSSPLQWWERVGDSDELKRCIRAALQKLDPEYPGAVETLFDEAFAIERVGDELGKLISLNDDLDPQTIAQSYLGYFSKPPAIDVHEVVARFLSLCEDEISKSERLAERISHRAVRQTARQVIETDSKVDRLERKLQEIHALIVPEMSEINAAYGISRAKGSTTSANISVNGDGLTGEIAAQIDHISELVAQHKPASALGLANALAARHLTSENPVIRYRIQASIALCTEALGDEKSAAQILIEASTIEQDRAVSRTNTATAWLVLENYDASIAAAESALALEPKYSGARAVLIQARARKGNESLEDLKKISEPLSADTALALGVVCRNRREFQLAKHYIEQAISLGGSRAARLALAEIALSQIVDEEGRIDLGALSIKQSDLDSAKQIFLDAWNESKATEVSAAEIGVALNCISACRMLGDFDTAIQVVREAAAISPGRSDLLAQRIFVEAAIGNRDQAIDLLNQIEDRFFAEKGALLAELYFSKKDYNSTLKAIDDHFLKQSSSRSDIPLVALKAECLVRLGRADEADYLQKKVTESGDEFARHIVGYAIARASENKSDQALEALALGKLLTDQSPPENRVLTAEALEASGQYNEAAEIYYPLIDRWAANRFALPLIRCLAKANRVSEAIKVLERLRAAGNITSELIESEVELRERSGDVKGAIKLLEDLSRSEPKSELVAYNLVRAHARSGDMEAVSRLLLEVPARPEWEVPELYGRYAELFQLTGNIGRAVDLAYRGLKRGFHKSETHKTYISTFLRMHGDPLGLLSASVVTVETAFCLETGKSKKWFFPEDDASLRTLEGDQPTKHPIVQRALGKSVGGEVVVTKTIAGEETATIVDIKNRYLARFHDAIENLNLRFPEEDRIQRISFDDPQQGAQAILRSIDARNASVNEIVELQKKTPMPMPFFAKAVGKSLVETIDAVLDLQFIGLKSCSGTIEERQRALKLLEERPALLLDSTSVVIVAKLGFATEIVSEFGPLAVTQATIDDLSSCISGKGMAGQCYSTLNRVNGQYVMTETPAEAVREEILKLTELRRWLIADCRIEAAIAPEKIAPDTLGVLSDIGDEALAVCLAAKGSNRILLSDDLSLRKIAIEACEVEGVWTQAVLMHLLLKGKITKARYQELVCELLKLNISYVSVDPDVLTFAAKQSFATTPNLLDRALEPIRTAGNLLACVDILVRCLVSTYISEGNSRHWRRLVFSSMSALCAGRPDSFFLIRSAILAKLNPSLCKSDIALQLDHWRIGHFVESDAKT